MKTKWTIFGLAMCLLLPAAALADINLVQNPGFESGTLNWTFAGWGIDTQGGVFRAHTGIRSAMTGCVGANCLNLTPSNIGQAFLYQDLATQIGMFYNLTFWYSPDFGTPNQLDVRWNGGIVQSVVNDTGGQTYEQITIPNLLATGSNTRLQFNGRQDPTWLNLDDVSVGAAPAPPTIGAVPEPSAIMLLATAIAGLGLGWGWRFRLARG